MSAAVPEVCYLESSSFKQVTVSWRRAGFNVVKGRDCLNLPHLKTTVFVGYKLAADGHVGSIYLLVSIGAWGRGPSQWNWPCWLKDLNSSSAISRCPKVLSWGSSAQPNVLWTCHDEAVQNVLRHLVAEHTFANSCWAESKFLQVLVESAMSYWKTFLVTSQQNNYDNGILIYMYLTWCLRPRQRDIGKWSQWNDIELKLSEIQEDALLDLKGHQGTSRTETWIGRLSIWRAGSFLSSLKHEALNHGGWSRDHKWMGLCRHQAVELVFSTRHARV
jgi:hypothetical protein